MSGRELSFIEDAFTSNYIAPVGPQLDLFEKKILSVLKLERECIALQSGTAALHLALLAAEVTIGDEVWLPSMTFAGGVFPISYLGATPIFFDVSPATWLLDLDLVEHELKVSNKKNTLPKVIITTDLYGNINDIKALEKLCRKYGIFLIIDAAESVGSLDLTNCSPGQYGDATILSFNGNKIITTSGGGAVITKHKKWEEKIRYLSTQARENVLHYEHNNIGYNYRLSNVSAAIGLGQLDVLFERVKARRRVFKRYKAALEPLGLQFMPEIEGSKSNRWLTTCLMPLHKSGDNLNLIQKLDECHIESRPIWKPMHLQPVYSGARYVGSGCDVGIYNRGICLPSSSSLGNDEQSFVIEKVKSFFERNIK